MAAGKGLWNKVFGATPKTTRQRRVLPAATLRTEKMAGRDGEELPMDLIPQPILPIARLAMAVHDGDDENVIHFDGVENHVRKNARQNPAHFAIKNPPLFRRGGGALFGVPRLRGSGG